MALDREHFLLNNALVTFKYLNGLEYYYLRQKFIKRSQLNSRSTRNSTDINIPNYRTVSGQRIFSYRATKIWNSLDKSLKNIINFKTVNRSLKGYLLQNCFKQLIITISNFVSLSETRKLTWNSLYHYVNV